MTEEPGTLVLRVTANKQKELYRILQEEAGLPSLASLSDETLLEGAPGKSQLPRGARCRQYAQHYRDQPGNAAQGAARFGTVPSAGRAFNLKPD
jgi:hypothetical protein